MTEKEFFVQILKNELPRFDRVFKAVEKIPKSKYTYKHDKKSRTTMELLANTFGSESSMIPHFLKEGKLDFMSWPKAKWQTPAGVRKEFMKNMNEVLELAKKMPEKKWQSKADMYMGAHLEWSDPRGKIAWEFLLDLIHHRGQLSTHLRPMGGKVPSIYGPSADSRM